MRKNIFLKLGTFDTTRNAYELDLTKYIQDLVSEGELPIETNLEIDLGTIGSFTGTLAQFNAAMSDGNFVSLAGTETLTNKTLTSAIVSNVYQTSNVRRAIGAVVTGTADATLSAANMVLGKVFQLTGGTGRTFTLDTGTALSAAMPSVAVGDAIDFKLVNSSTGTLTVLGDTGTTLANVITIATLQSRTLTAINTGTNTWTIY